MPFTKLPPSRPRGSRRDWDKTLQLPTRLELFTHGLVERQIATCGYLVWDVGENRLLVEHGRMIAEGKHITQELADHLALIEGLTWLIRQECHRKRILAYTDSRLVHGLLVPGQPVLACGLQEVILEARRILNRFPQLQLELVTTQENHHAADRAATAYVAVQEQRRRQRAREVVGELYPVKPGRYWVGNRYQVDLDAGTCTCPDFRQMHTYKYPIRCKHLLAADELRRQCKA